MSSSSLGATSWGTVLVVERSNFGIALYFFFQGNKGLISCSEQVTCLGHTEQASSSCIRSYRCVVSMLASDHVISIRARLIRGCRGWESPFGFQVRRWQCVCSVGIVERFEEISALLTLANANIIVEYCRPNFRETEQTHKQSLIKVRKNLVHHRSCSEPSYGA